MYIHRERTFKNSWLICTKCPWNLPDISPEVPSQESIWETKMKKIRGPAYLAALLLGEVASMTQSWPRKVLCRWRVWTSIWCASGLWLSGTFMMVVALQNAMASNFHLRVNNCNPNLRTKIIPWQIGKRCFWVCLWGCFGERLAFESLDLREEEDTPQCARCDPNTEQ